MGDGRLRRLLFSTSNCPCMGDVAGFVDDGIGGWMGKS